MAEEPNKTDLPNSDKPSPAEDSALETNEQTADVVEQEDVAPEEMVKSEYETVEVSRVSTRHIWKELMSILNLERRVFYTIWGLIRRPKHTVEEYLFRNRRRGAHPLRFLFLSTTLAALISFHVYQNTNLTESAEFGYNLAAELDDKEEKEDAKDVNLEAENAAKTEERSTEDKNTIALNPAAKISFGKGEVETKLKKKMLDMVTQYFQTGINIFTLMGVPFLALLTRLFWRKKGWYFGEHLVTAAFVICVQNVFSIIASLFTIVHPLLSIPFTFVSMFFTIYFYVSLFEEVSLRSIIKTTAMYFSWIVVTVILAATFVGIFAGMVAKKMTEDIKAEQPQQEEKLEEGQPSDAVPNADVEYLPE